MSYRLGTKISSFWTYIWPCLKGCSSCNPCPLCDQERTKVGGKKAQWVEEREIKLRSFGSLQYNFTGWVLEGMKQAAAQNKKWKSVTGEVIIRGVGDTDDMLIIDKIIPGPLHLYLSVNEVINYCESKSWPEIKTVLKDIAGVQVHEYMGKVGNYEGPSIRKVFRKLDILKEQMVTNPRVLYYNALLAFKVVSQSIFSTQLHPKWREHLHNLRTTLYTLATSEAMPITPKLHVLVVHVEQWIERNGRSLGKEGECSGEALHHTWRRMLEGQGEVKVKESEWDVKTTFNTLLRFNTTNT